MSGRNHAIDSDLPPSGVTAGSEGEPMIALRDVSKRYPGTSGFAVAGLSLEVKEGETVVLVGPSGCGKTTVLKMINRLIEPTSGAIMVGGRSIMDEDPVLLRRGIGYVIQSVGLLPHRTVRQNMATVPQLVGWDQSRTAARVDELAGMLELAPELLDRYPGELSGGQRQRVGVARALAVDPPVMLMDEPFGAVDPIVRSRLQEQFIGLQRRLKKTVVMVTHDIDEAIRLADRIAILNTGASLEQYAGPEEILRTPAGEFVKEFIGEERGLKRLALIRVGDIGCDEGPVVSPEDGAAQAARTMREHGYDWTSVVQDGRLLGWVDETSLAGAKRVGDVQPRPFSAHLMGSSTLREALDAIVTSRTQVAVVVEDGERYLGLLTLERISQEIIS